MTAQEFAKKFGYKVEFGTCVVCSSKKDAQCCLMSEKFKEGRGDVWSKNSILVQLTGEGYIWFNE